MLDVEKSKWCIQPDVLLMLAQNMERNGLLEGVTLPNGVKEFEIKLKSAMVESLCYLIEIRKGPYAGEIRIMLTDGESEHKVKVYENGVVLRWGAWAIELMETLPPLIARESKKAATIEESTADVETVLFDMLEKSIGDYYFNEQADELEKFKSTDRSGMPVNLLY